MKAVLIYPDDGSPRFADVPEPVPHKEDECLITVKAVAIKHLDRSRATGKHYSSTPPAGGGRVIGSDGVGILEDGRRVYALNTTGMLAEKAVVERDRIVPLPEGLDDATAAALPNAVIGAAMGLRFKADIQPGDVVLINGATGFTGRVAVQLAKYYGARIVIATGRIPESLNELHSLGADETISITDEEAFRTELKALHSRTPFDVVIDYLWGQTAEQILNIVRGNGSFTNKVRFVSVGSMTGDIVRLSAAVLRSVDLQLTGSGMGAWSKVQIGKLFSEILPETFSLAAEGKLTVATTKVDWQDGTGFWNAEVPPGRRLVLTL
jgi:NADPH:quinone reductase-like Zn-dependent oxidoreductase